jgi:hypothetical protein
MANDRAVIILIGATAVRRAKVIERRVPSRKRERR